ncbi:MAG TPA: hypothetical protein VJM50_18165 [Pyrinomonadaceae bacterium]|nr:hypothetical protein [Pyrinomonadaceae bacterium]
MELKISEKMHNELAFVARNVHNSAGTLMWCSKGTEKALLKRGLLTYDFKKSPKATEIGWPVVSAAGWEYLASKGIQRPSDEGRTDLEEALEQAYAECPCDDHEVQEASEYGCCDHAPMYHGARGCDQCSCKTPRVPAQAKSSKITPEMVEALRWLRKRSNVDVMSRAHFDTLDNAGVFSAIDEMTGYDIDPEPCSCPVPYPHSGHNPGCPQAPVSKCTCPKTVPQVEAGNHFPNCPGDPAEWGDMAYTTKPTAADNIRSAVNLKW